MTSAAAIQSAVAPAVLADLEAAKADLRASLPGVLRLLWFGNIWAWVAGVVFNLLWKLILSRAATWLLNLKVSDVLEALKALAAMLGFRATAAPLRFVVARIGDESWTVHDPLDLVGYSDFHGPTAESDARDFAAIKNHNASVSPAPWRRDALGPVASNLAWLILAAAVVFATVAFPAYLDWRDENYIPPIEVVEPPDGGREMPS